MNERPNRDARKGEHYVVANAAGEAMFKGQSDAECVRWWQESGRPSDYLVETGELMSELERRLGLDT